MIYPLAPCLHIVFVFLFPSPLLCRCNTWNDGGGFHKWHSHNSGIFNPLPPLGLQNLYRFVRKFGVFFYPLPSPFCADIICGVPLTLFASLIENHANGSLAALTLPPFVAGKPQTHWRLSSLVVAVWFCYSTNSSISQSVGRQLCMFAFSFSARSKATRQTSRKVKNIISRAKRKQK